MGVVIIVVVVIVVVVIVSWSIIVAARNRHPCFRHSGENRRRCDRTRLYDMTARSLDPIGQVLWIRHVCCPLGISPLHKLSGPAQLVRRPLAPVTVAPAGDPSARKQLTTRYLKF